MSVVTLKEGIKILWINVDRFKYVQSTRIKTLEMCCISLLRLIFSSYI